MRCLQCGLEMDKTCETSGVEFVCVPCHLCIWRTDGGPVWLLRRKLDSNEFRQVWERYAEVPSRWLICGNKER